jgi:Tol biopolymer transport system component
VRQDGDRASIVKLDPASGRETTLAEGQGTGGEPTPGANGDVDYWFHRQGTEDTSVYGVSLQPGTTPRFVVKGSTPWVASGSLFFLGEESTTIRRRALDGTLDEVLYEAAPGAIFDFLVVSPDGKWLATNRGGHDFPAATPLCVASLSGSSRALDCTSFGSTTSHRPAFTPDGRALYFARGGSLVRLDLSTHDVKSAPLTPSPTTLAVAPDGASLVYSTCRRVYQGLRVEPGGAVVPLPAVANAISAVGPHGEVAFSLARDVQARLAVADPAGGEARLVTSDDHSVSEAAFSPDGKQIVFRDVAPNGGGLFVVDAAGGRAPVRITGDSEDEGPVWIDPEHVAYMHAESGLPNGRVYVVPAAGGEPTALPKMPGALLGAVPARGTLLLWIETPSDGYFAEATPRGQVRRIVLRGTQNPMRFSVCVGISPAGRYAAWYLAGEAWRADLVAGVAGRVKFEWPQGRPETIQPDDDGRVTLSFRHPEGQLYRVRGRFP